MSSVLNVVITNAGIAEVINAQHTGTAPVVLAQVGFGQGIYTPTADQTAMQDEIKRVSTIAGGVVGSNIMHIQALDSGEAAYAVYEIGVYTASGTLFAIYSQSAPILNKVADSSIMCVFDFVISGVEPTSVTVGDTDFTLAPATTTNQGVVEIATDDEVVAGTDTTRAVTPAGGAAAYVSLTGNQTIAGSKSFRDSIFVTAISKDANQLADADKKLDITLFCGTQEDDYSVGLRLSYGMIDGVVNYALTMHPDNLAYSKTTSIGTPTNRLSTVYASNLDGLIPRPGANPPDVGSIFLACVPTPGSDRAAGTTVTATPGNPIYYAAITTTGSGGNYSLAVNMGLAPIETGTYTLLSAINPPASGPAQAVALVMRTA